MQASTVCAGRLRLAVYTLALTLSAMGGVTLRAQMRLPAAYQGAPSAGEKTTPAGVVPEKQEQEQDENKEYLQSPSVQKLGHMVGLNPEQAATTFTVLNFLVLLAALAYLLLKTLPKTFRKRNSDIQKNLVDARTATEEATARLSSVEARLSKLDDQIASMRSQAESDSAREEQRIQASVEEEKKKIVAAAEAEIQAATAMARRELQSFAADLAIEQAARKLVVSAETDRLLVESFAHRLLADKGSEN